MYRKDYKYYKEYLEDTGRTIYVSDYYYRLWYENKWKEFQKTEHYQPTSEPYLNQYRFNLWIGSRSRR